MALPAYTVTVTDLNGCMKDSSITISQPGALLLSSSVVSIIRNLDIPESSSFYQVKNYVELKVSDKSNFGVGISYQKAEDYYDGIILRAGINNSFNSKLTMRTKIQYSDFSNSWFVEPMITYQPNAFSALYFGVNNLLETDDGIISNLTESRRQIFIKFQYLF